MRLGLLGGTFDPIHRGHLDVAHAARRALQLDVVWLTPSRLPPHRRPPHASAAHRFAMVALAVADQEGLLACDVEMDTPGPSYTVDTLDRLEAAGLDLGATFVILGADAFRDIALWKDYPNVLDRTHFVAVSRPGLSTKSLPEVVPDLAPRMRSTPCAIPRQPSILLVEAETAAISSTDVRRARAASQPLTDFLPPAVAAHIIRHDLYGARLDASLMPRELHEDTDHQVS